MVDSIGKIREPERELEVFEDRQRRRYIRGMVLTRLIAAAIVADGLLVSLEYRCLPPLVVSSALAIALYMGVRWVKGLLIAGFGLGVPLTLYMLLQGGLRRLYAGGARSSPRGGHGRPPGVLPAGLSGFVVQQERRCLSLCSEKRIETRPYCLDTRLQELQAGVY